MRYEISLNFKKIVNGNELGKINFPLKKIESENYWEFCAYHRISDLMTGPAG